MLWITYVADNKIDLQTCDQLKFSRARLEIQINKTRLDPYNPGLNLFIKQTEFELDKTQRNLDHAEPHSYPPITIEKNYKFLEILLFLFWIFPDNSLAVGQGRQDLEENSILNILMWRE